MSSATPQGPSSSHSSPREERPQPHPYRRAWETRDLKQWGAVLAPEIIMHSPITRKPLRGRELAIDVFTSLFDAIGEFQITEEIAAGDTTVFCWTARYRNKEIEGVDVVRLNGLGQVKEIRVLIRPLLGIAVFGQALGPPLAATRTAVPRSIVRMLNAPLTLLFKLIDAIASRLLGL